MMLVHHSLQREVLILTVVLAVNGADRPEIIDFWGGFGHP